MTSIAERDASPALAPPPAAPSARAVMAAVAGMAAAWLAAGSIGIVGHGLRHALAWIALAVAIAAAKKEDKFSFFELPHSVRPGKNPTLRLFRLRWRPIARNTPVLLLLAAAVALMIPAMPVYNLLAVATVLAALAWGDRGWDGRLLVIVATAATVLAVWVFACGSIASAWCVADGLGGVLGRLGSLVSGQPLSIGATYAGLDFLVLMAAVYAGWLLGQAPCPSDAQALAQACHLLPGQAGSLGYKGLWAAAAILGGHLLYLVVLAHAMDLYDALPPAPPPPQFRDYIPPPWHWSEAARSLLPWNLPLVAGLIQLAVAAAMFRWGTWLAMHPDQVIEGQQSDQADQTRKGKKEPRKPTKTERQAGSAGRTPGGGAGNLAWSPGFLRDPVLAAPLVVAVLVALLTNFGPGRSDLAGKKIVACNQGYLDWERPVYDRYGQASAGMYGMLPDFVASLGGLFQRSDELAAQDLDGADVLLLIHPAGEWPQERIDRLRDFVRAGGSLLLLAGTPVQEGENSSSYNAVLKGLLESERPAIEVRFDAAVPVAWNWQESYWAMAHPAVTGVEDGRNRFGMSQGPSLRLRWPARPMLVGRWGWSDPGIDSTLTQVYRYDAGEKLGDLVLAAEQRLGRGRIVVLSDASSFTNEGNVTCYVFTGRLLAYLAGRAADLQAAWRQVLAVLGCLALVGLIAWRPSPARLAAVAVVFALAVAGSRALTHVSTRVLPDGRLHAAFNNVACIDASHMEAYSDAGWGYDGVAGLALTLMRSGLQPFLLPELTSERLERAGLLISIGPARPFSWAERATVREFVEQGGVFLCTVGADRAGPVQPLLEQFQLRVPPVPIRPGEEAREPAPMGHFHTLYRAAGADYDSGLLLYHAWPVECQPGDVLVRGFENLPIVAARDVGRGKVILIGDTAFAMNKNLEYVGGEPFNGRYENAHFWRWLLTSVTGQAVWLPPPAESKGE